MRAREGALLSGQLPSGARVVTIWIVDLSRYKVLTAVLSSTELITFEELSAAALVVVRTNPQLIARDMRYYILLYMAPPAPLCARCYFSARRPGLFSAPAAPRAAARAGLRAVGV